MPNFFKNMKEGRDGENISTDIETVGRKRRIGHSLRDYIKTLRPERDEAAGRTMMKGVSGPKSHLTRTGQAADVGSNVVGASGVALGGLTLGIAAGTVSGSIALGAGLTLGVLVTGLTGGIAAIVIGVAALAVVFVKSAYSNRDGAHMEFQKYVWTLVDSDPPTTIVSAEQLYRLSGAALTLLEDGKNQITRLGPKLKNAGEELRVLNQVLLKNEQLIQSAANFAEAEKYRKATHAAIKAAMKKGGAIYNFTRRAVHTGNYLQAGNVVSLAMHYNFSPSKIPQLKDPFDSGMGAQFRILFEQMGEFYESILAVVEMKDAGSFATGKASAATAQAKSTQQKQQMVNGVLTPQPNNVKSVTGTGAYRK